MYEYPDLNRTLLELKQEGKLMRPRHGAYLNRTLLELKRDRVTCI